MASSREALILIMYDNIRIKTGERDDRWKESTKMTRPRLVIFVDSACSNIADIGYHLCGLYHPCTVSLSLSTSSRKSTRIYLWHRCHRASIEISLLIKSFLNDFSIVALFQTWYRSQSIKLNFQYFFVTMPQEAGLLAVNYIVNY